MSETDLNEKGAELPEARRRLSAALGRAGIVPTEALADGTAMAFRAAIWALQSQIGVLVRDSPQDLDIDAATAACAKTWMDYAYTLPEGDDRRLAERAAETPRVRHQLTPGAWIRSRSVT